MWGRRDLGGYPAKALGQNLVDGATDLQAVLDDAVAGITQPVAE